MAQFQMIQGQRYVALVKLGFFESMVGNERIASELVSKVPLGELQVTGNGDQRQVVGRWLGASQLVDLPSQVVAIRAVQ